MKSIPFFTIGIPVYNTARWVGACLESILSQDFEDYEIICVDDGSSDDSVAVIQSYANKDNRIKIVSRPNDGPSTARNALIMHAAGRYMYMIDSDDTMCEGVLSQSYEKIVRDNYPDILQLGLLKHHTIDGVLKKTEWMPEESIDYSDYKDDMTKDDYVFRMLKAGNIRAEASSKFIRRDLIMDNGLAYQSCYSAREDGDFAIRLLRKAERVSTLKIHSFIYYLPREGSISTVSSYKTQKSIITYYANFFSELEFWKFSDTGKKLAEDYKKEIINFLGIVTITMPAERPKEECFKLTALMDNYFGKDFRKMSLSAGRSLTEKAAFLIYKILGIKYGFRLLYYPFYYWLKFRKVI